jgi:hypothetical protein
MLFTDIYNRYADRLRAKKDSGLKL